LRACLDSAPLVTYALDGHPQFDLARKVISEGETRPVTTDAALASAYKQLREIQERHRTGVLQFVGAVFAAGYTVKANLNAAEVGSVLYLLPKNALGKRLEADLRPILKPGLTGGEVGVILNGLANEAQLTDPTMFYKVIRLYVDVVQSPDDPDVIRELADIPRYEMELILAASAIGKTGKTISLVTSNPVLLQNEANIRAKSGVAAVKTLKQYVADHMAGATT
jgi:hypothetical protein